VNCGSFTWTTELADGPAQFSLRPENIRLALPNPREAGNVRVRGNVSHQAFHGATELIRVDCGNGLMLVVRIPAGGTALGNVELEFSPADAVPVRKSAERI
jgi:hypothetical protein